MADPLSVSASVVAVFGTAVQIARSIEKIRSIVRLPNEFASLFEEVAALQGVLEECSILQHSRTRDDQDSRRYARRLSNSSLEQHASRAHSRLQKLAAALQMGSTPVGLSTAAELKSFWTCIVHGKSRLSKHKEGLRDVRIDLSASLQLFTA